MCDQTRKLKPFVAETLREAFDKLQQKSGAPTQRALARRIGISESQLGRYLTGEREPRASEFLALTEILGIGPEAFLSGSMQGAGAETSTSDLIAALNALPEERREQVIRLLVATVRTVSGQTT